MQPTPRFAVIITHSRPTQLQVLVSSLSDQVDGVVIVDNASDPPVVIHNVRLPTCIVACALVRDDEQPPNLYRLWNVGLNVVHELCVPYDTWDVGIFNDDAVVPAGWWDAVSTALRSGTYAAASSDAYGHLTAPMVKHGPDGYLVTRMCPWAFITRGELGLRADEEFRWWFGDTDFDWQCRRNGGVILVPGYRVDNTLANSTTVGVLAEQAGRDRETFARKWGIVPW